MSEDDLKAIEARLVAATPGPWEERVGIGWAPPYVVWVRCEERRSVMSGEIENMRIASIIAECNSATIPNAANAAFIAHAPEDIAALLAEVRRLRALWLMGA